MWRMVRGDPVTNPSRHQCEGTQVSPELTRDPAIQAHTSGCLGAKDKGEGEDTPRAKGPRKETVAEFP